MKREGAFIATVSIIGGIVLGIALIVFVGSTVAGGGIFNPRINHRQMERIFIEDYELLRVVVDYFENSIHDNAFINSGIERGQFSISGGRRASIKDEQVVDSIEELRRRGYDAIAMVSSGVHFQRWSMRNRGHGIAFSLDGSPPSYSLLPFLTKLEPLSKEGWFYYEEDFNEHRRRRQEEGR